MKTSPVQFKEILVQEALPLLKINPPTDLPVALVHQILSITLEYYMSQMFVESNEANEYLIEENWKKIFEALELCGRMLKWEILYVPYMKNYSKDFYWQKLVQIVGSNVSRSAENKQTVFCTCVLFFLSLQDYISLSKIKENDTEIQHILVEGFVDYLGEKLKRRKHDEVPRITIPPHCSEELSTSFNVATSSYKLLQSDPVMQFDFSQLVLSMPPISNWINRFLLDLSIYMGRVGEEAIPIIEANQVITKLEKNLRFLSYSANPENPMSHAVQACEYIVNILSELPHVSGSFMKNLTMSSGRHLVLLPMTKKAIVQYCVQIIVNELKYKLVTDPTGSSDNLLGNLLVLLQLEFSQGPQDTFLVETIFEVIRSRRAFCYLLFPNYIINIDFLEEFMSMWHHGEVKLEFVTPANQRRIGTRGADRGVKEDFKQIISQQVLRCNEDIVNLIIQFIQQEHVRTVQCLYEK